MSSQQLALINKTKQVVLDFHPKKRKVKLDIGDNPSKVPSLKASEVIPKFIANRPSNDTVAAKLIKTKRSIIAAARQPVDKIARRSGKVTQQNRSPVANFHLDLSDIHPPIKNLKSQ